MAKQTHFLDLDKVLEDLDQVVVTIGGVAHHLVHPTVETFIENTKLIQTLKAAATSFEDEFMATVTMVSRSFPTIGIDNLKKLTFAQVNALLEFAQGVAKKREDEVPGAVTTVTEAPVVKADVAAATEVAAIGSENPPVAPAA